MVFGRIGLEARHECSNRIMASACSRTRNSRFVSENTDRPPIKRGGEGVRGVERGEFTCGGSRALSRRQGPAAADGLAGPPIALISSGLGRFTQSTGYR